MNDRDALFIVVGGAVAMTLNVWFQVAYLASVAAIYAMKRGESNVH